MSVGAGFDHGQRADEIARRHALDLAVDLCKSGMLNIEGPKTAEMVAQVIVFFAERFRKFLAGEEV